MQSLPARILFLLFLLFDADELVVLVFDGLLDISVCDCLAHGEDGSTLFVGYLSAVYTVQCFESFLDGFVVATALEIFEAGNLFVAHFGIVDLENIDGILVFETVFVDTDDGLASGVDAGLGAGRSFFDTELGKTERSSPIGPLFGLLHLGDAFESGQDISSTGQAAAAPKAFIDAHDIHSNVV